MPQETLLGECCSLGTEKQKIRKQDLLGLMGSCLCGDILESLLFDLPLDHARQEGENS